MTGYSKFTLSIPNLGNFKMGKLIHTLGNCTLVNFSQENPTNGFLIPGIYIHQSEFTMGNLILSLSNYRLVKYILGNPSMGNNTSGMNKYKC